MLNPLGKFFDVAALFPTDSWTIQTYIFKCSGVIASLLTAVFASCSVCFFVRSSSFFQWNLNFLSWFWQHNRLNSFVRVLLLNWLWKLAPMCLRHHLLFKLGHCADLWRSTLPFCMSSMACRIPLCQSCITQTLGTSLTTICFSLSKNQYQLSPDSFSTKAMDELIVAISRNCC